MDGSADFLVKEDVAYEPVDAKIGADAKLAKVLCSLVHFEHFMKEFFVLCCRCLDYFALLKLKLHVIYLFSHVDAGEIIVDVAFSCGLNWCYEHFAVRHVALAKAGNGCSSLN